MSTTEIDTTPLTTDEAQGLTNRLRAALNFSSETVATMYFRRGWSALGYSSWDDYCETEFGGSRIRLPREDRQELVTSLHQQGMSVRAIAAATGVNRETVRQESSGDKKLSPAPVNPSPPPVTDLITGDDLAELNHPAPQRTTGIDGKSYARTDPKPEPIVDAELVEDDAPAPARKASRRPLPEAFWQATYDLTKVAERVARLAEDDRFPLNAEKVAAAHRNDLLRAIDALQGVVNRLTTV